MFDEADEFTPPEWNSLNVESKQCVREMLTWELLYQWNFNVFAMNQATCGQPLLFLGWAILGIPHAQKVMAPYREVMGSLVHIKQVSVDQEPREYKEEGYNFVTKFKMHPKTLCNFF